MVKCSLILPVYRRSLLDKRPLAEWLGDGGNLANVEVIVLGSGRPACLEPHTGPVQQIVAGPDTRLALACNEAARLAQGEFLLFLDDDVCPHPGWLKALTACAESHLQAGVVGSKILYSDSLVYHAGVVIDANRTPRLLYSGLPANHPAVNRSRRFQLLTAGCLLVRRQAFDEVGGFDPNFPEGYEYVDLMLRLAEQGLEIHYCHSSVATRLDWDSTGRFQGLEPVDWFTRTKWHHKVVPDDWHYYRDDSLVRFHYESGSPVQVELAPVLGLKASARRGRSAQDLLAFRSQQVKDLLKENLEFRWGQDRSLGMPFPAISLGSKPKAASGAEPPRLVHQGRVLDLGKKKSGRLVSLLMPTKNGAAYLREQLPVVLRQRLDRSIEIIAVDSGSKDETVDVLRRQGATVVSIDPRTFNHGLTRNLAAQYAQGDVLVFLNQTTMPASDGWLSSLVAPLDEDGQIAGICSRVLPRPEADLLVCKDVLGDTSGSAKRDLRVIRSWDEYRAMSHHQRRLLFNFHTVSAAIRPEVFQRIPFRPVLLGEDVLWAREVLEAGYKILHEPASTVYHSHNYSFFEVLLRNVDDGMANAEIVGRRFAEQEVFPRILDWVRDDWNHLEKKCRLPQAEAELWRIRSVMQRTAQMVGQWLGVNRDQLPPEMIAFLSLTERIKQSRPTRAAI